jgi:hypothetical protein
LACFPGIPAVLLILSERSYDQFKDARRQQCVRHLLRSADEMAVAATRGAVCFPRRVAELLRSGLDLRDRHAAGAMSRHGLAVARGHFAVEMQFGLESGRPEEWQRVRISNLE